MDTRDKGANLYGLLSKKKNASQSSTTVKELAEGFVDSAAAASGMLKTMRPIYLDGASSMTTKEKPQRKRKDRPLNAKERRALNVYQVDPAALNYDKMLALHELWKGYMAELNGQGHAPAQFAQKILKADLHGSIMTVTQCKNPAYVGMTGIMIQETMNLFCLLTKENQLKKIPKVCTVFQLQACGYTFTIYGKQLQFRSAERAVRKFKQKATIDL